MIYFLFMFSSSTGLVIFAYVSALRLINAVVFFSRAKGRNRIANARDV